MRREPLDVVKLAGAALLGLAIAAAGGAPGRAGTDSTPERAILSTFAKINQVPRCSKNEDAVSAWLVGWAKARSLPVVQDAYRNVVITVPATPGWEQRPGLVLQSHMDMVCLKTEGSRHDFGKDPVPLVRDGEWIRAKDTTLGADDGIGMAIALTIAERSKSPHPRLELLFTADEEKDMTGASGLGATVLTGSRFINLDSESDSVLTLGSAGGMHTTVTMPLAMTPLPATYRLYRLKVTGLLGGHSGVDINKKRASANVLAATLLGELGPLRLVTLDGGTVDNAIASSAEATFATAEGSTAALKRRIAGFVARAKRQYSGERAISITIAPVTNAQQPAASEERSAAAVKLVASLPQGVSAWSRDFPGLPETSNNIGIVRTKQDTLEISTFQRSFHSQEVRAVSAEIASAASAAGATSSAGSEFPAWPPNSSSALAKSVQDSYRKLFGARMSVQVIHAGLECGNIAAKYPAMDMVSIGPTLKDVHSTNEKVNVASLRKVWRLLEAVIQAKGS